MAGDGAGVPGLIIPTVVAAGCAAIFNVGLPTAVRVAGLLAAGTELATGLCCWLVVGLIAGTGDTTVFTDELTTAGGLGMIIFDCSVVSDLFSPASALLPSLTTSETATGGTVRGLCWTRAETVVPFPFWAMLAMM